MKELDDGGGSYMDSFFSDLAGYKSFKCDIYAVQENFLEITNKKYYMLNEIE